jgi:arginine N-succinyltransferase
MTVVRSVRTSDIDQLWELIAQATFGLTTLQITKDQLTERVESSEFAFHKKTEKPAGEPYVFVMEEQGSGQLVGTSCIFSKVGGFEPFYAYRMVDHSVHCEALQAHRHFQSLHLEKIHDGPTEIGSLFLLPEFRGNGRGRLLSLARFAFMARHPKRFSEEVIAEMRGVVHEDGTCPFWEAIGRHFFQMDFPQADSLSTINKSFIEDLMPKYPIYTCLLSQESREVLGGIHPQTRPALAMLEAEGFRRGDMIDIFDGGPVVHCRRDAIDAVQRCRSLTLGNILERIDDSPAILASLQNGFRAILAPASIEQDRISITEVAALRLQSRLGAPILYLPLHPLSKIAS